MADDPFAQFGGASVDTSSGSDPFAAFGGQSIDTSPDASVPFQNPPGSHRYSVLPWMEDAQGHGSLAMPEMLAAPIRGMVKGGQAALGERNAMSLSGDPDLTAAASMGARAGPAAEGLRYPGGAPTTANGGSATLGQRIVAASRDKTEDPETAASQVRVANGIDAIKQSDPTLDDLQAANNFKTTQQATINGTIRQLSDGGAFDSDPQLLTDLRTLTNRQALQRNNTIDTNDDGLLARIDDLDAHPDVKSSLRNAVIDLNTAAPYSFRNQMSGPFQVVGNKVGQGAGLVGGAGAFLSGHPVAGMGMMLGQKGEAAAGARIGAGLDRLFGTQMSGASADRINALKALGMSPSDAASLASSGTTLRNAQSLIPAPTPKLTQAQQVQASNAAASARTQALVEQLLGPRKPGMMSPNAPGVAAPEAWQQPSIPSPGQPPAPPPVTPTPMTRAMAQPEAWQQPSLPPNSGGQTALEPPIDPDTGLPAVDPVPVNTPLKAKTVTPPAQKQSSSFAPNTPSDVRAAVADDDSGASSGTPSPSRPAGVPSNGGLQGGAKWIGNNVPGNITYDDIAPHAQAAEAAGEIAPGTADKIAQGLPIDAGPFNLRAVQKRMLDAQQAVGLPPTASQGPTSVPGYEGIKNIPSYMKNLQEEQNTYDTVPQNLKAAANLIRSGKSKEERLAILQASGHTPEEQAMLLPLTKYGK